MDPLLGQIILWTGTYEPVGWAFCKGQELQIAQNSALYSIIGTIYGGNGTTTFKLPDLRGRVPLGVDERRPIANKQALGNTSGAETVTISTNQLPAHNHPATVSISTGTFKATPKGLAYNNSDGSTNIPTDNTCLGNGSTDVSDKTNIYNTAAATGNMGTQDAVLSGNMSGSVAVGNTGIGQPLSVVQPYIAMNYLIAIEGIYPSRP